MAEEKITLTRAGMEKLEKEYRDLIDNQRPEVIEELKLARSQGDLSENADYDAARNKQAQIEARITEIEHIKDIAVIIDENKSGKKINLGYTVKFRRVKDGQEVTVRLVGTIEANPFAEPRSVSDQSAIGKALIDHVVGDRVLVESAEPYEIDILEAAVTK